MTATLPVDSRPVPVLPPGAVVGIFRAPDAAWFAATAETLVEAGLRCLEFTLTTDGALEALTEARTRMPGVLIGVGTVRTTDQLRAAADAGADFAVSQVILPALVETAAELGLSYVPGALTPTEILTAWNLGVPTVKVSPIGPLGGPAYLKELRGPLPDVALMPTGGVTIDNAAEYLALGAAAVGVSASLVGDALTGGDLTALRTRATRLLATL